MGQVMVRRATVEDAPGIARVKIAGWRDAFGHFMDPVFLASMDEKDHTARWQRILAQRDDTCAMWIALEGDQVVGFIGVGANRYPDVPCDGELQIIYIDPSAQRKGVGRALLKEGVDWLVAQGYESMAVFVFRDNFKGTSFYRRMGAELFDSSEYEVGGTSYPDECYIWKSLAALQQDLANLA